MNRKNKSKKSKSSRSRSQSLFAEIGDENDESSGEQMYQIKTSKIMGRYMVATKDIKPGQLIIKEEPLVVGPCTACKVQCLGCYITLENTINFVKCANCGWPLCATTCPGYHKKHGHTQLECSILKECKSASFLNYDDVQSMRAHFQTIVPLRCLLLKTTDPSVFNSIMDMESHNEIRKHIPEVWNGNETYVVNRIIKDWGLTEFTSGEIHTICGILEVNCFEIGQQGINIRGLYPTAFLMSHDCVPNTNHSDEEVNYKLTVRASTPILEGQPITLSYAYTLQNTMKRREHLLDNKFFECCCARCSDPKELGAYTSALYCPKCERGIVLADNALNIETTWSCTSKNIGKCTGYTISAKSMKLLIERVTEEVDNIDCNDIPGMEAFLDKYRNVLYPTHYINLGVKISLSQLYGKIDNYLIYEMPETLLERKISLCKELMEIFDIIEPGYTRIRGVTLYELHAPLMIILTRQFEKNALSKYELKTRLREVVKCLVEASLILCNEPKSSPEGMMGIAAKQALLQIKDWENIVGKI